MKYHEAVKELLDGKFVCRKNEVWDVDGAYLVYLPGITHFLKVITQPKPNVIPYAIDIADSLAEDWEVSENPSSVLETAIPKE